MDANRKPTINSKHVIALFVVIVTGALILFTLNRSGYPVLGESTPMPYTINTGPEGTGEGDDAGSGEKYGIEVDVSEGQAQLQTPVPLPVVTGEPLSPQEVEDIFARLPALPVSPDEQTDFKYPVILLPPPRPGTTIKESFPPSEFEPTPQVESPGPLEVLRFAPEGEIPIAPFVSVTFNQPMVPLGTLEDLAAEDVPVQIDPPLPGTWRWMGTRTLDLRIRLRADRQAAQSDSLHRHHPCRDKIRLGRCTSRGGFMDFQHASTCRDDVLSSEHPAAPAAVDVRGVRPAR